ncbi:DUF1697 domain-containing protein [Spongiivirga citrea]|uniref:DUF1697 domain-containing protein n=1 Tax=Spongiivirga citrea TaxID=1481457 RepID=A0A6M0CQ63_9FLAO|nr:DUF1697 domain-containing protein [Spongiivirga citrea]NER18164.1 DUF1697 domain-containing protein [Spongiivirga citrea]
MQTYIALLRGINVSGQKKILMADLRAILEENGLSNVHTYIQSGNVVFQSREIKTNELAWKIKQCILSRYGFEVPVLVRTKEQLETILTNCPFKKEKLGKSYFTILHTPPDSLLINEVTTLSYEKEEFTITNECVYFFCEAGYGKAKFNNNFFEKKLKVAATTRNYKTMVKLIEMVG